jgi:hypothetical protein
VSPAFVRNVREAPSNQAVVRRTRQAALGLFGVALLADACWERYVGYHAHMAKVRHRLVRNIDRPSNSIGMMAAALLAASRPPPSASPRTG